MEMARALLLQSHSEQIAEYSGEQFELVMAQTARENDLKKELGLLVAVADGGTDASEAEPVEPTDAAAEPAAPPAADTEVED